MSDTKFGSFVSVFFAHIESKKEIKSLSDTKFQLKNFLVIYLHYFY